MQVTLVTRLAVFFVAVALIFSHLTESVFGEEPKLHDPIQVNETCTAMPISVMFEEEGTFVIAPGEFVFAEIQNEDPSRTVVYTDHVGEHEARVEWTLDQLLVHMEGGEFGDDFTSRESLVGTFWYLNGCTTHDEAIEFAEARYKHLEDQGQIVSKDYFVDPDLVWEIFS